MPALGLFCALLFAAAPPPTLAKKLAEGTFPVPYRPVELAVPASTAFPAGARPLVSGWLEVLEGKAEVDRATLDGAERLVAEGGGEPARQLLASLNARAASQRQARRDLSGAAEALRRALALQPDPRLQRNLLSVQLQSGDWTAAETSARLVLEAAPEDAEGLLGIGFALLRQDRSEEARQALARAVAAGAGAEARELLARFSSQAAGEQGMIQTERSHFHLRYDGAAPHAAIGPAVLEALEAHYTRLAGVFEFQPEETIPVILLTREAYRAGGAPKWAGGDYDLIDGRIRVPVKGLEPADVGQLESTLLHELTHAFVASRGRGVIPRRLHEALAEYMEGERLAEKLAAPELRALAEGRLGGVGGFYLEALSFAEFLMAEGGQEAVNEMLRAVGEQGDLDEAFRVAYGRDYKKTEAAWREWLKIKYGS